MPDRIRRLAYWNAFVLMDGESIESVSPPHYGQMMDAIVGLGEYGPGAVKLPFPVWREVFMNDASLELAQKTYDLTTPHPIRTLTDTLELKEFSGLQIPKSYINCTEDMAMPPGEFAWTPGSRPVLGCAVSSRCRAATNPVSPIPGCWPRRSSKRAGTEHGAYRRDFTGWQGAHPADGADWLHAARVVLLRAVDQGAYRIQARSRPGGRPPVDGRGLTQARPTQGSPLVYRRTWGAGPKPKVSQALPTGKGPSTSSAPARSPPRTAPVRDRRDGRRRRRPSAGGIGQPCRHAIVGTTALRRARGRRRWRVRSERRTGLLAAVPVHATSATTLFGFRRVCAARTERLQGKAPESVFHARPYGRKGHAARNRPA